MALLFTPAEAGLVRRSEHWLETRDGDEYVLALFLRHYSCGMNGRRLASSRLFVGPGEKTVLVSASGDACFVWRKFISGDGQVGVNCSIFRNEGPTLSSLLIREAMAIAWERWPGERLYTYVNPQAVRSVNPGYCFRAAGRRTLPDGEV